MRRFNLRAFNSLALFWTLVVETVTGLVLYIKPPGQIASWTDWKFAGFSKSRWETLHTIFGYLFIALAVIHIVKNRKTVIAYLRRKFRLGRRLRRELVLSLFLIAAVFGLTAGNLPPFRTVMDLGDALKSSWGQGHSPPLLSRAERLSFSDFAARMGIPQERARAILAEAGILVIDDELTIEEIARGHRVPPVRIFDLLKAAAPEANPKGETRPETGN